MLAKSISQYMPPALLALSAALVAANWYVQPDRVLIWATVVVLLGAMTAAFLVVPRRLQDDSARRRVRDSITSAIGFAGLMLVISLSAKLAKALGASGDADLPWRLMMAVVGGFLVFTGNTVPKRLTSLSALECDPARVQAVERLAGWTGVLTGLGVAIAWLALPLDVAKVITFLLLPSGLVIIAAQVVRLRRTRRRAV